MKIDSTIITKKIYEEFASTYKPFCKFVDSGVIWDECIKTVNDAKLMNNIVFCNDILQIPPTKVFLKANDVVVIVTTLFDKKCVGAFWGFVFKSVFNYNSQKDDFPINTKGIKKATFFYDANSKVEII